MRCLCQSSFHPFFSGCSLLATKNTLNPKSRSHPGRPQCLGVVGGSVDVAIAKVLVMLSRLSEGDPPRNTLFFEPIFGSVSMCDAQPRCLPPLPLRKLVLGSDGARAKQTGTCEHSSSDDGLTNRSLSRHTAEGERGRGAGAAMRRPRRDSKPPEATRCEDE